MISENKNMPTVVNFNGNDIQIDFETLTQNMTDFLEHYGVESLLGETFYAIIGKGSGQSKFLNLLNAAGFKDDAPGFCQVLIRQLEQADISNPQPVAINGVIIPYLLLVATLETLFPGNGYKSIKNVEQLEKLTGTAIPENQRADMQKVIDIYPVRLSFHCVRQMRVSKNVAYQYMPFAEELDTAGHANTWIGQFHQGLLEQMYQNRVIFLLNMSCPVYCRFCFRKHKESRQEANPCADDVKKAVLHIKNSPSVKEIVLTGGDPFLNRRNMSSAINGLAEIPHVQTLRLATRSIAYYPFLFQAHNGAMLKYLKSKNFKLQQRNKRMEVATHFIHPDEISPQSLDIITELVNSGIAVYIQTPFLKDCNDQGPELARLFSLLRGAGAELHYIYIPCSPIHGNSIYWTPLAKGLEAAHYLRAHLSDRIIPRLCTATAIGKIDWHTSGWAVEPDPENDHFIWLRTPYTPAYFKTFAPLAEKPDLFRVNAEGTIDARYMAQIGDDSLFLGSRKAGSAREQTTDSKVLTNARMQAQQDQRHFQTIVATGSETLFRIHETCVELHLPGNERDFEYIRQDKKISDVIVAAENDAVDNLYQIDRIIQTLLEIHHVNAVRLRSIKFNYAPHKYTRARINRLGELNHVRVVNPLRLEIETWFLHSQEIRDEHAVLAAALRNKGITVYNNTPLLGGINDTADEINRLACQLRVSGVEFHHLYAAGLPLQQAFNDERPVDVADVTDIATRVRRDGSGREIPRYIIRTKLGEVDFGLTSKLVRKNGELYVRLTPYNKAYYQAMNRAFDWPEGVETDAEGRPLVRVGGLVSRDDFMVSK